MILHHGEFPLKCFHGIFMTHEIQTAKYDIFMGHETCQYVIRGNFMTHEILYQGSKNFSWPMKIDHFIFHGKFMTSI